jgi:membrane associated rhomboid family serine protease
MLTPVVQVLLATNVAVYFLQMVQEQITNQMAFYPTLQFIIQRPWTMFTYMFLHGGLGHLFFNMLALFFFGPRVEERLGSRNFVNLYLISGLSGALLSWILPTHAFIIGASGAVFGVSLAFAMFWPTTQIMIWGIVPIQARWLIVGYTVYSLFAGVTGVESGTAHFAHLGGYAGAFLYLKWLGAKSERTIRSFRKKAAGSVPDDKLGNWKKVDTKSVHSLNRDEVNRILDKISAQGLSSLTPQERLFLSNFVPPDDRVPPVS